MGPVTNADVLCTPVSPLGHWLTRGYATMERARTRRQITECREYSHSLLSPSAQIPLTYAEFAGSYRYFPNAQGQPHVHIL